MAGKKGSSVNSQAKLSTEEINLFKKQEAEAGGWSDLQGLGEDIASAGDKDWARNIYQQAINTAEKVNWYVP